MLCPYIRQSYLFSNLISCKWFKFLTVLSIKFMLFWDAMLCSLTGRQMFVYFGLSQSTASSSKVFRNTGPHQSKKNTSHRRRSCPSLIFVQYHYRTAQRNNKWLFHTIRNVMVMMIINHSYISPWYINR